MRLAFERLIAHAAFNLHKFAISPAVTEKGYLDVKITVKSQGGHSSVPPEHTGIGIMAVLITALEAHPYEPAINAEHPLLQWAFCLLDDEAASPHLKSMIKQAARSSSHRQKLAKYLTHIYPAFKPLLSTTQASDVIRGGIKANALPEETTLIVNHRIGLHSSIKELQEHLVQVLEPVAASFGVPFDAFDGKSQRDCAGICVEALNDLEPAPVSSLDSPSWEKVSRASAPAKAAILTLLLVCRNHPPRVRREHYCRSFGLHR